LNQSHFEARSQSLEKLLVASSCSFVRSSVRPSVRMEQLGSYWTDFYEIWYLNIFRIYVDKIKVLLKCDKSKGYFT